MNASADKLILKTSVKTKNTHTHNRSNRTKQFCIFLQWYFFDSAEFNRTKLFSKQRKSKTCQMSTACEDWLCVTQFIRANEFRCSSFISFPARNCTVLSIFWNLTATISFVWECTLFVSGSNRWTLEKISDQPWF